jgi:predicted DNA-binding transcriptional regulator YafY
VSRPTRLFELVGLLDGRRGRTVQEMAERLEVSERTIFRDLADLQATQQVPILRDDRGYRLLETAKLRPLGLTTEERAVLRLALGHPALRRQPHLRRRLERLEAKIDAVTADAEETPQALRLAAIDRSGPAARGALAPLEKAIGERREVEILYASLSGGSRRWRGLDPYQVFEREGAWYVAGRCHRHDEPRTFRLDRIAEVRPTGLAFEPPARFDLDRYLADAWGVFRGGERHAVVLRFDAGLAPLIEAGRHHHGEAIERRPDGTLEYRVHLSHLDEIARWVVGFGGRCRVVGPEGLRERVVGLARGVVGEFGINP